MNTELILLAVLMGAATYPARAIPLLLPGIHRLPPVALSYIRLVGPAVLAALAAIETFVVIDAARTPSFHLGIVAIAVGACLVLVAFRRGLLVGVIVAAIVAAVARANGVS